MSFQPTFLNHFIINIPMAILFVSELKFVLNHLRRIALIIMLYLNKGMIILVSTFYIPNLHKI